MMESLVQGKLARRVRWGGCRNVRSERNEARCVLTQSIQERRDAYEIRVKRHPNYYDEATRKQLTQEHALNYNQQATQLPAMKELRPEYHAIHSQVLQDVLRRGGKGDKAVFCGIKEGEKPGHSEIYGYGGSETFSFPHSGSSPARER